MKEEKEPFRSRLITPKGGTFEDAASRRAYHVAHAGHGAGGAAPPAGDVAFSSGFSTGFH